MKLLSASFFIISIWTSHLVSEGNNPPFAFYLCEILLSPFSHIADRQNFSQEVQQLRKTWWWWQV